MATIGQGQQQKQIEEIIDEANKIWAKVQQKKYDIEDTDASDALLEDLRTEHRDFHTTLPLVLRTMVQMRSYNPKALERYLKKMKTDMKNWKSRRDFIESQADYMIILYKIKNPRYNTRHVQLMRQDLVKQLLEEEDAFVKMVEEAEKESEDYLKNTEKEQREELFRKIMELKMQRELEKTAAAAPPVEPATSSSE
jgi:hypothetical protein